MAVEASLYKLLTGDPFIAAYIAARAYPELPQEPTYPAITYQLITEQEEYSLSGRSGLIEATYQIDVYASTRTDVIDLASRVRTKLSGFRGTIGGVEIQSMFYRDGVDMPLETPNEPRVYRRSLDFEISYGVEPMQIIND